MEFSRPEYCNRLPGGRGGLIKNNIYLSLYHKAQNNIVEENKDEQYKYEEQEQGNKAQVLL